MLPNGGRPEPGAKSTLANPVKSPVAGDNGPQLETVLSNVFTSAMAYCHPPLNVLNDPEGSDDAIPWLIHIRFGLSLVKLFNPVANEGLELDVYPERNGASKYPLVSVMIVLGRVKLLLAAHAKSVVGPMLLHRMLPAASATVA
jgi:hypothetical protein